MVTGQPVYVDAHSAGQARAFSFDLEQRPGRVNPNPGWFNEESLQSLLFDLYDNGRDVPPGGLTVIVDDLALGFAPIWAAFTNEQRTTRALTSVFPFVNAIKVARPADQSQIDNLTTSQQIASISDAYGTGQTNFGIPTRRTPLEVAADFHSVYDSLAVGATLSNVCSLDDYTSSLTGAENKLASRRFVRFTVANPGTHVITVRARAPLNARSGSRPGAAFRRRAAHRVVGRRRIARSAHRRLASRRSRRRCKWVTTFSRSTNGPTRMPSTTSIRRSAAPAST